MMSMIKNAKVHPQVTDPDVYHAQEYERGDARLAMSPSSLKAFGQCPARWRAGYNPPDTEAKAFGSLVDCLALTPELFAARYAVHPANYQASGMECPKCKTVTDAKSCRKCGCERVTVSVTKEWNFNADVCEAWRVQQGKREIVSPAQLDEAQKAVAALMRDEVIKAFLSASDRQVMVTAEWHDEATGIVLPVRCLMDLVPRVGTEFDKSLGDLKTTRSAALKSFTRYAFTMGYHIQGAFDLDMFVAATGQDRCNWCFVLQENYPPFQTGKRLLSEDFLTLGRVQYRQLLASYCACLKSGVWPGYDDTDEAIQGWSLLAPEPWMESEFIFAPKFQDNTAPADEPETIDVLP